MSAITNSSSTRIRMTADENFFILQIRRSSFLYPPSLKNSIGDIRIDFSLIIIFFHLLSRLFRPQNYAKVKMRRTMRKYFYEMNNSTPLYRVFLFLSRLYNKRSKNLAIIFAISPLFRPIFAINISIIHQNSYRA